MSTPEPVRLTRYARRAGCAAKHPQDFLLPLLGGLPAVTDPNVLVGSATADDAAVYKLSDDLALVMTTDFFTPIVDRPYDFGVIAAANALSDVYAMNGVPFAALSIVGFPDATLTPEVLAEILQGAAAKAGEAGVSIIGGHTIKSEEPIFGLAVVGRVHPDGVLTNAGARPGDALVLTKPLGSGIITTAAKRGEDHLGAIDEAITVMSALNRDASRILAGAGARALTDVTGFGLLGHLRNIVAASDVSATIWSDRVPVMAAAREYARVGVVPGGTHANRRSLAGVVRFGPDVDDAEQLLLCDAQTSGGLLGVLPADRADEAVRDLRRAGTRASAEIGRIEAEGAGGIRVSRGAFGGDVGS
ncbi:selenide, water dikinase SelD [Paludisphaera soli]|uniref:selenide, water dikinase SelD n=1 Tax=Paludisphaera soli TaxID=2712865 RepID=UPI0013ECB569|nr:selenide, water dikinase SelD [Paludisphaera soli]